MVRSTMRSAVIRSRSARRRRAALALLTAAGSGVWNALFVGAGYALGSRWSNVEKYSQWLDYAIMAFFAIAIGSWVVTRFETVYPALSRVDADARTVRLNESGATEAYRPITNKDMPLAVLVIRTDGDPQPVAQRVFPRYRDFPDRCLPRPPRRPHTQQTLAVRQQQQRQVRLHQLGGVRHDQLQHSVEPGGAGDRPVDLRQALGKLHPAESRRFHSDSFGAPPKYRCSLPPEYIL